jgi:ketosteroid isomerase-like protein
MSSSPDRIEIARTVYHAFVAGERQVIESLLAPDFVFFSPPDPGLDREGYFEKCWPNAGSGNRFELVRLIESGDEVIVTYEATRTDGSRFRNTEVLRASTASRSSRQRSTSAGTSTDY